MGEKEEIHNEFYFLAKLNIKIQQDQSTWRKKHAELEDKYKKQGK